MKQLAVFLILSASLTACSSTPRELPTCDVPAPMAEVGHPLNVPEMPQEVSSTVDSATYDLQGLLQLKRLREASLANKTIAESNALAIEARNTEVNELIECARYQLIWMEDREDMLEQERRDHFIDNLWHRGVIVLIGVAVAL